MLFTFQINAIGREVQKPIDTNWTFKNVDINKRLISFQDVSIGKFDSWEWDFGDEKNSQEQNPINQHKEAGKNVVVLLVEVPAERSRTSKVLDIGVK